MIKDEESKELERMIDVYGIKEVVSKIGDICFEKAQHLVSNWRMSPNSIEVREWEKWGKRLA